MKLLHTTDLHFNKAWFSWIADQQNSFDIFCISGDFLESSKEATLLEQIAWVSRWIKAFEKPLFVCSGNHDIEEFENEEWLSEIDSSSYYADNVIKTIEGISFGSYPYIGAEGFYEFDNCDVLITHMPPANTKTSTDKNDNDWGDRDLYRALKNATLTPRIILCGHMHYPSKTIDKIKNTTIYNPGVAKTSAIPNHHIVDLTL